MSVLIKGLNIKPCEDGFGGKGLVIIGYDDKLYAVAHEQIIPLPEHGDLIERDALKEDMADKCDCETWVGIDEAIKCADASPVVIPAERSEE